MLLLLFIFPFPTLHLIAQGDWWVSVELADCDDPLCWRLSGGLFPHNHWRRPMLTFRNEAPAGICRRCKCVPSHSNGFTCSAPPAVCVVFVVVNSVCGWTTSGGLGEGGGGCIVGSHSWATAAWRQWTYWAALTQCSNCLSKEKTRAKRITITSFLISIGNEQRHQDLLRAPQR